MLRLTFNKAAAATVLALTAALSFAAKPDLPAFQLALKDHQFYPQKLSVPAGQKFKLVVANLDAEPAEFESFSLHREQVVVGKSQAVVFLGPLKAGSYDFIDDFHPKVRGTIAALAEKP